MFRLGLALTVSLLAFGPAQGQPKGVPAEGKRIAERWCATCHIVSPEQESGNADVMTFMAIARKNADDLGSLATFLVDPHPVMADTSLTQREIADLVAYIGSLQ
ncbi:c-type cytochrome [Jiella marina]|uniref:c-type cytochrome n=1 Tax=Jiella sp. LLJ827 TaxID=2917712 RepID=UPI002101A81B|nr:cytochrome c [Jiella sp. LLJ827]MCQ0989352.1 cytochrome c [Jiella sp. LLJ827]